MWITQSGNGKPGHQGMMVMTDHAMISENHFEGNHYGIIVLASHVTIINNTFTNNTAGVDIRSGTGHVINDNEFTDNLLAISVQDTVSCLISHNRITGGENGVIADNVSSLIVQENHVEESVKAIFINVSGDPEINNNTISGSKNGVILDRSPRATIHGNEFILSGLLLLSDEMEGFSTHSILDNEVNKAPLLYYVDSHSLEITGHAGQLILVNCTDITLRDTEISRTTVGIQLAYVKDSRINENIIRENTMGIYLYATTNTVIQRNSLILNDIGLVMLAGSDGNTILHNNISANSLFGIDARYNGIQDVAAEKNFWGHGSGPFHPVSNPEGLGDNITDTVSFQPWLQTSPGKNIWYVDASALPGGDGTADQPFTAIQDAVDNASRDEVIIVRPGYYRENVVIPDSLEIRGVEAGAFIDASGETGFHIISGALISNLTFLNASTDLLLEGDAYVYNTTYTTVEYTGDAKLSKGYYLDIKIQLKNGEPIPDASVIIRCDRSVPRTILTGPDGWSHNIPMIELVSNSTGDSQYNPYYIDAYSTSGYSNLTLNIGSNTEIILNLSLHGKFGSSAVVGDINGDGIEDHIVGSPDDPTAGWNAGSVSIFYGSWGKAEKELIPGTEDLLLTGEFANGHFGYSLDLDDINSDGLQDLIVLAIGSDSVPGNLYLYSGEKMLRGDLTTDDGIRMTGNYDDSDVRFNGDLETCDLDQDGYPDILVGFEKGQIVFHGQSMIFHETFQGEPMLSNEWDQPITGDAGEVDLDPDNGLRFDTFSAPSAYAYIISRECFTHGFTISGEIGKGNNPYFLSAIDYKVPESEVSNFGKQSQHSLFELASSGSIRYTPDYGAAMQFVGYNPGSDPFRFRVEVTHDHSMLRIFLNERLMVEESMTGWSDFYIKVGDSTTLNPDESRLVSIAPELTQTYLLGIDNPVYVNLSGQDTLAVSVGDVIHYIPVEKGNLLNLEHHDEEDYNGTYEHIEFDDGLTICPYNFFSLFPNGNFEDGWDHWYLVENEQGKKNAGRRTLTTVPVGYWVVHNGTTAGFGANKDYPMGVESPSDGRLRSDNVTLLPKAEFLQLWYHWYFWGLDENTGYPDELNIKLRRTIDDTEVLTIAEHIPEGTTTTGEAEEEIIVDIRSLIGNTVYLSADIITDGSSGDQAFLQIDDVLGAELYEDLSGEYISSRIELTDNHSFFISDWDADLFGGEIRFYFMANGSDEWSQMIPGSPCWINSSSFSYKVEIEAEEEGSYPVIHDLRFSFYHLDTTRGDPPVTGIPVDAGPIFDDHTLAILNNDTAIIYNGTDEWFTINADNPIQSLTSLSDVDGNGVPDVLVSANESVYIVLLESEQREIQLEDTPHVFSGAEGFGSYIYRNLVGSPNEYENDGRLYILPLYLNDTGMISTYFANNTLVYPDTQIEIGLHVVNTGLYDAPSLEITMDITGDDSYDYQDMITISLDSWDNKLVHFPWHIPDVEGTSYTITFSIPDDHYPSNNRLTAMIHARYHSLDIETAKDYDAVQPNDILEYQLTVRNTGTFGQDNITLTCDVPDNWHFWITRDGENITGHPLEDFEDLVLHIRANTTETGIHDIHFTMLSENGYTQAVQDLVAYVVLRDLIPLNATVLRADGKEASPVAGVSTTIQLRISNMDIQGAGPFPVQLFVDGTPYQTVDIPGCSGNTILIVNFSVIFDEGTHELIFSIDPLDQVTEYNEDNNDLSLDVDILPEYSTTSFLFRIHVEDIHGDKVPEAEIIISSGGIRITGMTDENAAVELLLPPPFKEGSIFVIEALKAELYNKVEFRVYSEDAVMEATLVVGRYSLDMTCLVHDVYLLPSASNEFEFDMMNTGDFNDSYDLTLLDLPAKWSAALSGSGISGEVLDIDKNTDTSIKLNITTWKYAPAYTVYDMALMAASHGNPYMIYRVLIRVTVLPVENITMTAGNTVESGIPGDSISHRLTIVNEGNTEHNVTLVMEGAVEYAYFSKKTILLSPGDDRETWFIIAVPRLRGGSILEHQVYAVIEQYGTTQAIQFTTHINDQHSVSIEITEDPVDAGYTLIVENTGNVLETFDISGSIDFGTITISDEEIIQAILDIDEIATFDLNVHMTDMGIPAGTDLSLECKIFNGDEYIDTDDLHISVPIVHDIALDPVETTVTTLPGQSAEFSILVTNNGNSGATVSFGRDIDEGTDGSRGRDTDGDTGVDTDGCRRRGTDGSTDRGIDGSSQRGTGGEGEEELQIYIPSPFQLDAGEQKIVLLHVDISANTSGTRSLTFTAFAGTGNWSTQLELIINDQPVRNLTFTKFSVRSTDDEIIYTIELLNNGSIKERIGLNSSCGHLDLVTVSVAPGNSVQFHLMLPAGYMASVIPMVRASSIDPGNLIQYLELPAPPIAGILVVNSDPITIHDDLHLIAPGEFESYEWMIGTDIILGQDIFYTFKSSGIHEIQLTVTDALQLSHTVSLPIQVENLAPVIETEPFITSDPGNSVEFDAGNTLDPDGNVVKYLWHVENMTYEGQRIYHVFFTSGTYTVTLIVTDNLGTENSTTIQVTVHDLPVTVSEKDELNGVIISMSFVLLIVLILLLAMVYKRMDTVEGSLVLELDGLERKLSDNGADDVDKREIPSDDVEKEGKGSEMVADEKGDGEAVKEKSDEEGSKGEQVDVDIAAPDDEGEVLEAEIAVTKEGVEEGEGKVLEAEIADANEGTERGGVEVLEAEIAATTEGTEKSDEEVIDAEIADTIGGTGDGDGEAINAEIADTNEGTGDGDGEAIDTQIADTNEGIEDGDREVIKADIAEKGDQNGETDGEKQEGEASDETVTHVGETSKEVHE